MNRAGRAMVVSATVMIVVLVVAVLFLPLWGYARPDYQDYHKHGMDLDRPITLILYGWEAIIQALFPSLLVIGTWVYFGINQLVHHKWRSSLTLGLCSLLYTIYLFTRTSPRYTLQLHWWPPEDEATLLQWALEVPPPQKGATFLFVGAYLWITCPVILCLAAALGWWFGRPPALASPVAEHATMEQPS